MNILDENIPLKTPTVIEIPNELVPVVRELIAKHRV